MEFSNLILFDDPLVRNQLLPFTFTRPVADIRVGITTIREKWEKRLNAGSSTLTVAYLWEKFPVKIGERNLLINGALLPDKALLEAISSLKPDTTLVKGRTLLAAVLNKVDVDTFDVFKVSKDTAVEYKGDLVRINHPWDIFSLNDRALRDDYLQLTTGKISPKINPTNTVLGEDIFIEEGATANCAIFNTTTGPIYIGKDAEVMEGSVIRGPFALCDNSVLKMGAKIYGATTIGPFSKVGGEVNNSVIFGYSNKAHDGFLGNSVIGEWCNLGADTNNSNLKNNYAEVKIWNYSREVFVNTGTQFCGLFMGDHSKCGINTMFNTGTVVGVSANIFGSGFPRNFIPSFSWGGPAGFTTFQLDKAAEIAQKVMKRRNVNFDKTEKHILTEIFSQTEKYRSF